MQMPARTLRMSTLCRAYALHNLTICSATDEAFAARFGRQFHREVRPVQLLYMHSMHTYIYIYIFIPPSSTPGLRALASLRLAYAKHRLDSHLGYCPIPKPTLGFMFRRQAKSDFI